MASNSIKRIGAEAATGAGIFIGSVLAVLGLMFAMDHAQKVRSSRENRELRARIARETRTVNVAGDNYKVRQGDNTVIIEDRWGNSIGVLNGRWVENAAGPEHPIDELIALIAMNPAAFGLTPASMELIDRVEP